MSRADRLTPERKKLELWSDIATSFVFHPLTGDVARVTNEEAVKQSVRNLVLTAVGERPFSDTGSKVNAVLFDHVDDINSELLVTTIQNTIRNWEDDRVVLEEVEVAARPELNRYHIRIVFSLTNRADPISLDMVLRRVR